MALDGLGFYPGFVRRLSKKPSRRLAFLFTILSCCARILGMVSYHLLVRGPFSGRGGKFKAKQVSRVLTIFWRVRATQESYSSEEGEHPLLLGNASRPRAK